jgi:hypothetical protein
MSNYVEEYYWQEEYVISEEVLNRLKYWNGTSWIDRPLKYWNGSSWITKSIKSWNGTSWI